MATKRASLNIKDAISEMTGCFLATWNIIYGMS